MGFSRKDRLMKVAILSYFLLFAPLTVGCSETRGGPSKEVIIEILQGSGIRDNNPRNDFSPYKLRVKAGTRVTWINKDNGMIHSVNTRDRLLNSPILHTNDRYGFIFKDQGEYQYYCGAHPWMRGAISVR